MLCCAVLCYTVLCCACRFEVTALSWAEGAGVPTLASVADDLTVRVWRADPAERARADTEAADEQF